MVLWLKSGNQIFAIKSYSQANLIPVLRLI